MWMHTEKVGAQEWLEVTLLYSSVGIVIEVDFDLPAEGASNHVEIREESPVWRVTYFDPGRFQDLLDSEILINERPRNRPGDLMPWPGLGAIHHTKEQSE